MQMNEITEKIIRKYPHLDIEDIEEMIDIAKDICLSTLYPFDDSVETIPKRKVSWIYRCVIEQLEKKGATSAIAYKENGVQINFDKTQISQGLLNELLPVVGV